MIAVKNSLSLMCASGSKVPRYRAIPSLRYVYRFVVALLCCCACAPLHAAQLGEHRVEDLDYGRALYRFFQGDQLARITDNLPGFIESERKYLLTNLYLGNRQYDEAADLSNRIDPKSIWKIYAGYNLAVARIEDGDYALGKHLLDQIGQMESKTPETIALRDRANLSLGLKQLRLQYHEAALESLERVRLKGPLSHQALLATGWARYRLD